MAEPDPAPQPPSGELKPGQGLDRLQVCVGEGADIADHHGGVTVVHKQPHALAEDRAISATDASTNDKVDRARLRARLPGSGFRGRIVASGQLGPPLRR
jgi:hypothetical protein